MIQRFLDAKGSNYDRVLMADAGQTFFQGNPFDIIGDSGESKRVLSHSSRPPHHHIIAGIEQSPAFVRGH